MGGIDGASIDDLWVSISASGSLPGTTSTNAACHLACGAIDRCVGFPDTGGYVSPLALGPDGAVYATDRDETLHRYDGSAVSEVARFEGGVTCFRRAGGSLLALTYSSGAVVRGGTLVASPLRSRGCPPRTRGIAGRACAWCSPRRARLARCRWAGRSRAFSREARRAGRACRPAPTSPTMRAPLSGGPMRPAFFACLVLVAGCGGASSSGSSTTAEASPLGNAAVTARAATVPAPPIPRTTTVAALTTEQAAALCPWVSANVATPAQSSGSGERPLRPVTSSRASRCRFASHAR